jgi:hypothetical protein
MSACLRLRDPADRRQPASRIRSPFRSLSRHSSLNRTVTAVSTPLQLPYKLTFDLAFGAKSTLSPAKAHLCPGVSPVGFHHAAQQRRIEAQNTGSNSPRKDSPMTFQPPFPPAVDTRIPSHTIPENAHPNVRINGALLLNPLTSCPAYAHGHPRISSRSVPQMLTIYPAELHLVGRKGLPDKGLRER